MRISIYSLVLLACIFAATAYGANTTSSNSSVTEYSTILINTPIVMPNYQSEYVNFVIYPLANASNYTTTLELQNQNSFTQYNMSIKLINSSGYAPFVGQILISPTIYTPSNTYSLQLRAVGGNPTGFTDIVNVTILNRTLYNDYVKIQNSVNSITNGNSTSVSTVPATQQTTTIQNPTSSAQTSFYSSTTTIAATTIAGSVQQGGNSSLIYAAIIIVILAVLVALYFLIKNMEKK